MEHQAINVLEIFTAEEWDVIVDNKLALKDIIALVGSNASVGITINAENGYIGNVMKAVRTFYPQP